VIRPDNVCHELGATSVLMETTPWWRRLAAGN
jgi:hypothetical protein